MVLALALALVMAPVVAGAQKAVKKAPRPTPSDPSKPCPRSCCDRCNASGAADECRTLGDGRCECCSGEGPTCHIADAAFMARFGYACTAEDDAALSRRASTPNDPCGAAGTWTVACAPEPNPAACPLAGQVPAGTLSAAGRIPSSVAASGGQIALTATSGPVAGKAQVIGRFDSTTCVAEFRTLTPQCGPGSSRYEVREGRITGTRQGGTTCCSGLRQCTGTVQP